MTENTKNEKQNIKNNNNKIIVLLKKHKKLLIVCITLLFIIIFILNIVVVNLLNPSKLKNAINTFFKQEFAQYQDNYNLKGKESGFFINGSVNVFTFPKSIITLNDIKIRNIHHNNIKIDSNISSITLHIKLIPLFFKKIAITHISINRNDTTINLNQKLVAEYKDTVIVKKIIKLDENEISGIGDKIKGFLQIEEKKDLDLGLKEIEVEEERTVIVDNTLLEQMLLKTFKQTKNNSLFSTENLSTIALNSNNFFILNDTGNTIKKFSNVNSNILFSGNKTLYNITSIIEGEKITVNFSWYAKKDTLEIAFNSNSDIYKKFLFEYEGKAGNYFDPKTWNGNFKLNLELSTLNKFVKIFSLNESILYNRVINNDKLNITGKANINNGELKINDFKIFSNNIDFLLNFNYKNEMNFDFNIKKFNVDSFFIRNISEKSENLDKKQIAIFNAKTLEELLQLIQNNFKVIFNKNTNVNIKAQINNLTINKQNFINNVLDIYIENQSVKINQFNLNIKDDLELKISNPNFINNIYVHDLSINGKNSQTLLKSFNIQNNFLYAGEYKFQAKFLTNLSKFIIFDSVLEIQDYKSKIDIEYEFFNNPYLAVNINLNKFNLGQKQDTTIAINEATPKENNAIVKENDAIVKENKVKPQENKLPKEIKTAVKEENENPLAKIFVKEKMLFLNNLNNNLYVNLEILDLNYNNFKNMYLNTYIKIDNGYLNINFNNSNLFNILNLNGVVNLNLQNKAKSVVDINLYASDILINANLIPHIININKYVEMLNKTNNSNKNTQYWVDLLFKLPIFNEVFGTIKLNIGKGKLNDIPFNSLNIVSSLEDGLFNIQNLSLVGFGGNTNISGILDLKERKELNILFKKTIYNLEDIQRIILRNDDSYVKGIIGLGGYIKSVGTNPDEFNMFMDSYFEFLGNTCYIKALGIRDLQYLLTDIYRDKETLKTINPKEVLISKNSGTIFKNIKGFFFLQKKIMNLSIDAKNVNVNNKFLLTINNSDKNMLINLLNSSAFYVGINETFIPLYTYISFKEDLKNKAILDVNVDQVNEYLNQIRTKVAELAANKKEQEAENLKKTQLQDIQEELKKELEKENNNKDQILNNIQENNEDNKKILKIDNINN